jgi:hypothetical protein
MPSTTSSLSQNQLFYPAVRGTNVWYDPMFRVKIINGRDMWCKCHYRVRHGCAPDTFHFSVLNNGIMSDELLAILGANNNLGWVAFHCTGAAEAIGQRYIGGLLCTPDGRLLPSKDLDKVWRLF